MAKILIVEDNQDFNRAVSTYLSQYGHDVFSAYTLFPIQFLFLHCFDTKPMQSALLTTTKLI